MADHHGSSLSAATDASKAPPPPGSTRILLGDNPFDVAPTLDLLHEVRMDVPSWSETQFFQVWSPDSSAGVFVHTGRWPGDLDLWWAQVIAMLPDGTLLVDRSWGRAVDSSGPATGNLRVHCQQPLKNWRIRFDGAGEPSDLATMAGGPIGSTHARAFSFDIELQAIAPVWDMHGALGIHDVGWASRHHTQGMRSRGVLQVEGLNPIELSGVGCRDHSSGPRILTDVGGLQFFVVVFPESGRVANGLVNWRRSGEVAHRVYTIQQAGRCEIGFDVSVTGLAELSTHAPHNVVVNMRGASSHLYRAQWLHGYTLTLLEPNLNVNGAVVDAQDDPLFITQGAFRVVADDGEIGWGVVERDYRRSMLPAPQPR